MPSNNSVQRPTYCITFRKTRTTRAAQGVAIFCGPVRGAWPRPLRVPLAACPPVLCLAWLCLPGGNYGFRQGPLPNGCGSVRSAHMPTRVVHRWHAAGRQWRPRGASGGFAAIKKTDDSSLTTTPLRRLTLYGNVENRASGKYRVLTWRMTYYDRVLQMTLTRARTKLSWA